MLIEFRVSNYRSFSDEEIFSLVASQDDSHPENLLEAGKLRLVKTAAVFGANASGKSNLVKAMKFVDLFVENSATRMNQGDKIPHVVPFRLDLKLHDEPSCFAITFSEGDTVYSYSFSVTPERVYKEKLEVFVPGGRGQCWFERAFDAKTKKTAWTFRPPLKKHEKMLKERTRENGLVLSRGAELNVEPLVKPFVWFREKMWSFDLSAESFFAYWAKERALNDEAFISNVTEMIKHADLGIEGIDVEKEIPSVDEMSEKLRGFLTEESLKKLTAKLNEGIAEVYTLHRVSGTDRHERFKMDEESAGTQRFFELAGLLLDALDKGAVVLIDELENSMHPLLVRKLIELFQSPQVNRHGAQLVFTTHNAVLMDSELLRRDQIWFVEKRQNCSSELYSLYDFETKERPRKDALFQRGYLAGRFGAIPHFGSVFEDLTLE